MKFKKHIGFTLAELMVILAVLTVLLAAFAPVFTVRYKNSAAESVWSFVKGDDEFDIYSNPLSDVLTSQLFIGMQPTDKTDVNNYLKSGNNVLHSKLVIRASNKLGISFGSEKQKQIKFQYGSSREGKSVGTMFAGNQSILLGGDYKKISDSAKDNTAFGSGSLDSLTTGTYNSAFGTNAGQKLTTGKYNTLIGYNAGSSITDKSYNTIVGYNAGSGAIGEANTVIGNYSGTKMSNYNTIIGEYAATKQIGSHNTAIGYRALDMTSQAGDYNTAVGHQAMTTSSVGSYNTAIGSDSCNALSGASYKTCIGYKAGSLTSSYTKDLNLFKDTVERIFIGTKPLFRSSTASENFDGGAVLEVHNINSKSGTYPIRIGSSNFGDSSVVINGNLIVRGQPFIESRSYFYDRAPALIGFTMERPKDATHLHCFMGKDGSRKDARVPGRRGYRHAKWGGHTSCVCSRKCSADTDGVYSYDWTSRLKDGSSEVDGIRWSTTYTDLSLGGKTCNPSRDNHEELNIDINYAHGGENSCCPDLASDIRLKDLTTIFDDGLNAINRLTVYNYTYKADEEQQPQVGVIAQDLKRVFPNAVSKDKNGYYQIRWDEMFYAAINAIKTLDSKIEALASRVSKDRARIATLKKDNANLEKKLNSLANELTELEKK